MKTSNDFIVFSLSASSPGSSVAREIAELGIDSFRVIPLAGSIPVDSIEESSSQEVRPQNNESINGRIYSLFRFIIHLIYIRFD